MSFFPGGIHISIHALRVEGDWANSGGVSGLAISIHALRVEGDFDCDYCAHRDE